MDNPGLYDLAVLTIAGAVSPAKLVTPKTRLAGMASVTLEASLQFGSGSGTVIATVVTALDGGTKWRQIARFEFTSNQTQTKYAVIGTDQKAVTSYADLATEGVNQGLLGDCLAVLLSTTGTFSDTVLSVRAAVR